jgi:transposase-like protein
MGDTLGMKLKELKERSRAIRAQYEGKYHVKWPDDFKKDIVRLLENGESMVKISKATGIAHQTIDHWRPNPRFKKKSKKFQEVSVFSTEDTQITLSWSGGLEVSGLSFSQFCELLDRGLL